MSLLEIRKPASGIIRSRIDLSHQLILRSSPRRPSFPAARLLPHTLKGKCMARFLRSACWLAAALVTLIQSGRAADDLSKWRYSREVRMDTTAAGANVSGDVKGYPVALALDAKTFDFSQAQPNGADVRFTAAGGAALPFSIE